MEEATSVGGPPGRSPHGAARFPVYDLASSEEVARVLHQHGGGAASTSELAALLGYSRAKNGAFIDRLAAARMFGLVTTGGNITLTDRARAILMPEFPESAARARVEAFEGVPLYRSILQAFEGQVLPGRDGMRNALQNRFGVPAFKVAPALERMMSSAQHAGLFFQGDRTRLLRPRLRPGSATPPGQGASSDQGEGARPPAPGTGQPGSHHKLIQGALDELPPLGAAWDETAMRQWLQLMEHSIRVIWKVPPHTQATTE
jgi:hypothetical protein